MSIQNQIPFWTYGKWHIYCPWALYDLRFFLPILNHSSLLNIKYMSALFWLQHGKLIEKQVINSPDRCLTSKEKQDICQNIYFKFVFIMFWKCYLLNFRQLFQRPFVGSFCVWTVQWHWLGPKTQHSSSICFSDPILSCQGPSIAAQRCTGIEKTSIRLIEECMCSKETKFEVFILKKSYLFPHLF